MRSMGARFVVTSPDAIPVVTYWMTGGPYIVPPLVFAKPKGATIDLCGCFAFLPMVFRSGSANEAEKLGLCSVGFRKSGEWCRRANAQGFGLSSLDVGFGWKGSKGIATCKRVG